MILQMATAAAMASGLGLAAVSLMMLFAPRRSLAVLAVMGSTPAIHFGEMAVRALVGAALVVGGGASRFPDVLPLVGWFLIGSAAILSVLPRRWHSAYSIWWSHRIPVIGMRAAGLAGALAGAAMVWIFV